MHKVSVLAFPLRADIARLRRFVDSYLNFVDDECPPPFYFQPMGPYVLFELLHYPYLAVTTRNLISYPQHEMQFIIPLECYAIEDGAMVFKQFAVCSPFIYLEEELSIVSGRTIFGLPKIALKFDPVRIQDDPRTASQMAQLQLRVATQYGDSYVPFIEVFRDPARFISARNTQRDLVRAFPDAVGGYLTSVANTWETLTRSPLAGYDPVVDSQSMFGRAGATFESFLAGTPVFTFFHPARPVGESTADFPLGPLYSDVISLKQARDVKDRDCVSFQSLVRSTMYIDRLNDFGSLSSPGTNDASGGITIKIHNIATQPVIESLGLEVIQETIVTERSERPNEQVLTLKPEFPYWLNLDLTYGLGTNLYWRGKDTDWSSSYEPGPRVSSCNRYLTFGGGASQEDPTLLMSPDGRIWVLALELDDDGKKLEELCGDYLRNDRYDFTLYRGPYKDSNASLDNKPYVWLLIRNLVNTGEGKGPNLEHEVEFCALVQWSEKGSPCAEPPRLALMPIFVFSDCQSAVITETEVLGRPTVMADINYSSDDWTDPKVEPSHASYILNIATLLPPVLYSGQAPEKRTLLQIVVNNLSFVRPSSITDTSRNVLSVPSVSLKQVDDCRTPESTDFQAIVMQILDIPPPYVPASYDGRVNSKQLQKPLPVAGIPIPILPILIPPIIPSNADFTVRIYRYNSVPLVDKIKLKVNHTEYDTSTTVEVINAVSAAYVEASVQERGAINFAWQSGDSEWKYPGDPLTALEELDPNIGDKMAAVPKFLGKILSTSRKPLTQKGKRKGKKKANPKPKKA
jgi:hypothetical protein